jgi:hypothetical protein
MGKRHQFLTIQRNSVLRDTGIGTRLPDTDISVLGIEDGKRKHPVKSCTMEVTLV